jgi:hypothetical protein
MGPAGNGRIVVLAALTLGAALSGCGPCTLPLKTLLITDRDHDSWTPTYDNPQLFEWLLGQKRSTRGTNDARARSTALDSD